MLLDILQKPWPWYLAGPLIGLIVPLLLVLGNKTLGISSSFRHLCAACFPAKIPFFSYDWKKEIWNFFFVGGVLLGGIIAWFVMKHQHGAVNENLVRELATYGLAAPQKFLPPEVFSWNELFTLRGVIMMVAGGFLVGFGTRYAGGCTSGHSIMGLSNLQWPSLVATVCFMAGGFFVANIILPIILKL